MVGVYALIVGALKLGFLLDFVSGPVLTGWISAVALVILLGQVGSLVGLTVGSTTVEIIRGVLGHLDKIQGMTACIGLTGIAMLLVFEHVGKTIGKKNKWIKFVCTSRAAVVLIIYTLISWGVNKDRSEKNYMWAVTEIDANGLAKAKTHDTNLLAKVAGRSVAPFIAMSIEHLGVGKAFGLRNGYDVDRSQELLFLGTANMVASIQGSMASGGAMSRTAVCSEAGSRSPLNFIFTAGFVLLTLYELAPALYWIPKATLAAIIVSSYILFMWFCWYILDILTQSPFLLDHGCRSSYIPTCALLSVLEDQLHRFRRFHARVLGYSFHYNGDRPRRVCRLQYRLHSSQTCFPTSGEDFTFASREQPLVTLKEPPEGFGNRSSLGGISGQIYK